MWLMQHLMNQEANIRFGANIQSIPLKTSATIVCDNALTRDWNEILPAESCSFILGNPPFLGAKSESDDQTKWKKSVYPPKYKLGQVDFVSSWFVKASTYMNQNRSLSCAFVSTNSICQGEQVSTLWGLLFDRGIHINFAYTTFPWDNEANIYCVIIGFSYKKSDEPFLVNYNFKDKSESYIPCKTISPYLTNCKTPLIIKKRSNPWADISSPKSGAKTADNGNLLMNYDEGASFIRNHPEAAKFVKRFIGSKELMNGETRFCLWLTEETKDEWSKLPYIVEKVEKCRKWRESQTKSGDAYKLKDVPWRFREQDNPKSALVLPSTTSESRYYVPLVFIKNEKIVNNSSFYLPDATYYDFGILSSRMHMCWMRLTAGRLENRYRYSRDLTFNTFVWPESTCEQKENIVKYSQLVLVLREEYSDIPLGELYKPNIMPIDLKDAHNALDYAVESSYRKEPFNSDEERLEYLLNLYLEAIENIKK